MGRNFDISAGARLRWPSPPGHAEVIHWRGEMVLRRAQWAV